GGKPSGAVAGRSPATASILLGSTIEDVVQLLTWVGSGSAIVSASAKRMLAFSSSSISIPNAWLARRRPWSPVCAQRRAQSIERPSAAVICTQALSLARLHGRETVVSGSDYGVERCRENGRIPSCRPADIAANAVFQNG